VPTTHAAPVPLRLAPADDGHPGDGEIIGEDLKGSLMIKDPTLPFAFIRAGDLPSPVFVLMRDVPEDCRCDGARVTFTAVRNFDRKKNRDGARATEVRRAG